MAYIVYKAMHYVDAAGYIKPISTKPRGFRSNIIVLKDGSYDFSKCPPLAQPKEAKWWSIYGYRPYSS